MRRAEDLPLRPLGKKRGSRRIGAATCFKGERDSRGGERTKENHSNLGIKTQRLKRKRPIKLEKESKRGGAGFSAEIS